MKISYIRVAFPFKEIKFTYVEISQIKRVMIEVYKILHGIYDKRVTIELFNVVDQARTRGH